MAKLATNVVRQAKNCIGYSEKNGKYKRIINTYNTLKPLPRGYKAKYSDDWCAIFVSACAVMSDTTDIIPTECSCPKMIELFKELGCWKESDSRVPKVGDIIFYDWDDNGVGNNKGSSDHVGIVEKVNGSKITVIEGNMSNGSVGRRVMQVNGKYIRGYGVPKYDEPVTNKTKSVSTLAREVIAGKWGTGEERKKLLEDAGYDYNAVQKKVNYLLGNKKSITYIAKEVIDGKWGNGDERKKNLEEAGYNYYYVQQRVNELLK